MMSWVCNLYDELLSQFVHDLNEDFLPFYLDSLNCLISLTKDSIVRQKSKPLNMGSMHWSTYLSTCQNKLSSMMAQNYL